MIALLEWNNTLPVKQTWRNFNFHFTQAYNVHLATRGTKGDQYHGAVNAAADKDNTSIVTQSFAAMHHATTGAH